VWEKLAKDIIIIVKILPRFSMARFSQKIYRF
jgi:hypothetical protein